MNPLMNFNQIISQYNAIKNNPKEINKILLNSGRISNEQYEAIKDMNPAQTGQYLLNNGLLGQGQVNQLSQMIPQIQQALNGQQGF